MTPGPNLSCDDADGDGVCDAEDNCPDWSNPSQRDANGDGRGDACTCGDVNGNGVVNAVDVAHLARHLTRGGALHTPDLCDVVPSADGGGRKCNAGDLLGLAAGLTRNADLGSACRSHRRLEEHVLLRTGYGGDSFSRARIQELGIEEYILEQLDPTRIDDSAFEALIEPYRAGSFATLGKSVPLLESQFCNLANARCTDHIDRPDRVVANLAEVKFLRAIHSRRQLESVLLDFWLNHFNVDASQGIAAWAEGAYEDASLRPYLLGSFEDLLVEMTRSLAMLDYLDLRRSRAGNLNENFARELMELHSIGNVATFDEIDVQEVTRVLTGYTYGEDRVVEYRASRHDDGVKIVSIEDTDPWIFDGTLGCGNRPYTAFENESEVLLCLLARHPKTATRISRKLIARFVTETPSPAFVSRVREVWLATDGDIESVMREILLSTEFLSMAPVRNKVKRPLVLAASLARALGPGTEGRSSILLAPVTDARRVTSFNSIMGDLATMGEPLYQAAPPTGFPEASAAWASAGGVLFRINLADRLIAALGDPRPRWGIDADTNDANILDRLEAALLPGGLQAETREAVQAFLSSDLPTSATQGERVRQTASVLLSTPEFLLH